MVNCNPETVSTDYDTSRPAVLRAAHPRGRARGRATPSTRPARSPGSSCQLGGQTPLGLAQRLKDAGVPIVGTTPESRSTSPRSAARSAGCSPRPGCSRRSTARRSSFDEAQAIADEVGYPVLVRPSYVLGGRGMEIVYDEAMLAAYIDRATQISPEHPVLVDRFLDDAVEIDVDALYDGDELYLGGVMEHIEEAGIHSGDSACALPPITLGRADIDRIRTVHRGDRPRGRRARPAQRPVRDGRRTCSTCSRPTRAPRARCRSCPRPPACRWPRPPPASWSGRPSPTCAPRDPARRRRRRRRCRRRADRGQGGGAAVRPVPRRRHGARPGDALDRRGHGHRRLFGTAFAKSQEAAYAAGLPTSGTAFVSVANRDKRAMIFPIKRLADLGFRDPRDRGHRRRAAPQRRAVDRAPQAARAAANGEPTPSTRILAGDIAAHRQHAVRRRRRGSTATRSAPPPSCEGVPCITTVQGLAAAVQGIEALSRRASASAPCRSTPTSSPSLRAEQGGVMRERPEAEA